MEMERAVEVRGTEALHTVRVLVLCSLVILLEGFDLQAAGVSAPRLGPAFHLLPGQLGTFLGASALGVLLAAALAGLLADRIGRRPVLAAGVLLFGAASLATALAVDLPTLLLARLVTGLGLGAAMPVAIALASDHSPAAMKKRAVGFIYCAIPVGGALSGVAVSLSGGWRSVYVVGGVAPLVLAPLLLALLPRSAPPPAGRQGALAGLLGPGQATTTLALWFSTFGTLLVMYLLLGWMPTLVGALGLSRQAAQGVQLAFNVGGAIGAASGGYLLDRKLMFSTPAAAYLALAALLAVFGFARLGTGGAVAVAFGVGGAVILAQAVLYALAPLCYPAERRATGVGAAVAAGRVGTIAGPLLAGSLLGGGKTAADVLVALIPITAVAGIAALVVVRSLVRKAG
jgi:AAHS family 3-hydroxyphenylpropionic acid transporter